MISLLNRPSRPFGVVCLCLLAACQGESKRNQPIYNAPSDRYTPISEDRATQVQPATPGESRENSGSETSTPSDSMPEPVVFERRWVGGANDSPDAHLAAIVAAFNREKFTNFDIADFYQTESRLLATSHYTRYSQIRAGIPVEGSSIRIWSHPETRELIQIEAVLTKYPIEAEGFPDVTRFRSIQQKNRKLRLKTAYELVRQHPLDAIAGELEIKEYWSGGRIIEQFDIQSEFGEHQIQFAGEATELESYHYKNHLMADAPKSIPVRVYPLWELGPGLDQVAQLVPSELKDLDLELDHAELTDFQVISHLKLAQSAYNPDIGDTMQGRSQGLWNYDFVDTVLSNVFATLPRVGNSFDNSPEAGVRLVGKFARIFVHPQAASLQGLDFSPQESAFFYPGYRYDSLQEDSFLEPRLRMFGKPLKSRLDAFDRVPLPNDDITNELTELMNSGFDEVQMYWAIQVLFEELHRMGFTDPELSTRPFDAILFNPSINARNNAYYSRDTINFTNYSPGSGNFARDNTVIWHEIGHGLQDRLMGDYYRFRDSGGLNEGMADILAHLVVEARMLGQDFPGRDHRRINNRIGFHLTNESHDDGEAYGGAMMDITDAAIAKFGLQDGLTRASELIFETMRLTRDHPGITAEVWFEHMIFADSLHRPISLPSGAVRQPGEMRSLIIEALTSRNFGFGADDIPAKFHIRFSDTELSARSEASRGRPIALDIGDEEKRSFELEFSVDNGSHFAFKYPLRLEINYEGGPLQGAIQWLGQDLEPLVLTINQPGQELSHTVTALGKCEWVNRSDGTCSDFVYLKLYQAGASHPIAKKRFYVWSNGIEN